jgi:hypothetical protein
LNFTGLNFLKSFTNFFFTIYSSYSLYLGKLNKFHTYSPNFRFQKACTKYGLADVDLFQTTDLWDFKNVALVTQTIFAVGRAVSILVLTTICQNYKYIFF